MTRHANVHPAFQPLLNAIAPIQEHGPLEPAATPHSTPVDSFPSWRVDELVRKYNDPHEWDAELDSDGAIDDVDLEGSGADEESL